MTTPRPTVRGILLLALFAVPRVADAQPWSVPRVGVLSQASRRLTTPSASRSPDLC